jgi:hypothetical protein
MRRFALVTTLAGLLALAGGGVVAWHNHSHKLPTNCIVFSNGIGKRVALNDVHSGGEGPYGV